MSIETCCSLRPPQGPLPTRCDLRDMVRQHIVRRALACMDRSAGRRRDSLLRGGIESYCRQIREAVHGFYGKLPAGAGCEPPRAAMASRQEKHGYRIENVLFDSFPGWQVNATVYVPLDFPPPFPGIVMPVGHSAKHGVSEQQPAQYFARCGYLVITFDPPGQAGEKQVGNNHFTDGARCYLVGETSSRYFVADAIRCMDYLATRSDVNSGLGFAMTGVSGGGTTTTLATLLDKRVAAQGPSCCLTALRDLDISQAYAGCPETHMWRRYAEGVDEIDILCAVAPLPTLLMAGRDDVVFRIEDTRSLAAEVRRFYDAAKAAESFVFFEDTGGHAYSLQQAREFTRFLDRWFRKTPARDLPEPDEKKFPLNPAEELQCHPRTEINMQFLARQRGRELAKRRTTEPARILAAATSLCGATMPPPAPPSETGNPFRIWTHQWRQVLLRPEPDIELPATFLAAEGVSSPAILHFDDAGRYRHIVKHGLLANAVRFLDEERPGRHLFSVDLRGWGDSTPTPYPYDLVSWGGIDRYLAYAGAALGDSIFAMRVRDGLAAHAWLRIRPEMQKQSIVVTGCGAAGPVALHVAAIVGAAGAIVWDCLASFQSLLEADRCAWPQDLFMPGILLEYDLPELAAAMDCPTRIFDPRDGAGQPLSAGAMESLNRVAGSATYASGGPAAILEALRAMTSDG